MSESHTKEVPDSFQNSKTPPGWDGVSRSMREWIDEMEDWLGYTDLIDHPERVGPAILARLKGKPKLIGRELPRTSLVQVGGTSATHGYRLLIEHIQLKLTEDDEDFQWLEIKRFQKLFKSRHETYKAFIALWEVGKQRAHDSGYVLSGKGPTHALFEACRLSEDQRSKVLIATQGQWEYEICKKQICKILDPTTAYIPQTDTDEVRRRGNAHLVMSQTRSTYNMFEDPIHSPVASEASSVYEVSADDVHEFEALFAQRTQINKHMRKFKRPYRPAQTKKRWLQAGSPEEQKAGFSRRIHHTTADEEEYEVVEDTLFQKSNSNASSFKPAGNVVPGKNPINRKSGERMLCKICNSADHFAAQCPQAGTAADSRSSRVNIVQEHEAVFVDVESDIEDTTFSF